MSREASSDQSCICDEEGYDEVYPSSQDDPDTSYDERVLPFNSPSVEGDEDVDTDGSEGDSNDEDIVSAEPPSQSIIGPNGFRQFILLPLWTVNDFRSTIKKKHFDTLRGKYQIPVSVPIRLPFKFEKCYYQGAEEVGVYEQMFKVGLRFPNNPYLHFAPKTFRMHNTTLNYNPCYTLHPPSILQLNWMASHKKS